MSEIGPSETSDTSDTSDTAAGVRGVPGALSSLEAAIAALDELDLDTLPDDELSALVTGLCEASSKLAARRFEITSRWDAKAVWAGDGARSGAAWMAARCRMATGAARAEIRLARKLRSMPATAEALAEGAITLEHARALAHANRKAVAETFARDEERLVENARELRFSEFRRVLTYWEQLADPEEAEDEVERVLDDRRVHLSRTFHDAWALDGFLDPVGGTEVHTVLEAIERELFEADWAAAKAEHGDDVSLDKLPRTPAQRRADALVEMARRAAATPAGARRPRPLISVFVGYETFAGTLLELADGTPITRGTLVRLLLEDADIERVVWDGPSRVIDIGEQRLFTGALRRAVEYRDRTCTHPMCEEPAARCDVDHVHPWAEGGATTQTNGRLRCPGHHPGRRKDRRPRPPPER